MRCLRGLLLLVACGAGLPVDAAVGTWHVWRHDHPVFDILRESDGRFLCLVQGGLAWVEFNGSEPAVISRNNYNSVFANFISYADRIVKPDGTIICHSGKTLLWTSDAGQTWKSSTSLGGSAPDLPDYGLLRLDSAGGLWFCAGAEVYRNESGNLADAFTKVLDLPEDPATNIEDIEFTPGGDIYISDYYAKIHHYAAGSGTWTSISDESLGGGSPSDLLLNGNDLYICTYWGGLQRLQDGNLTTVPWPLEHVGTESVRILGNSLVVLAKDQKGYHGFFVGDLTAPSLELKPCVFPTLEADLAGPDLLTIDSRVMTLGYFGDIHDIDAPTGTFQQLSTQDISPQYVAKILTIGARVVALDQSGLLFETRNQGQTWQLLPLDGLEEVSVYRRSTIDIEDIAWDGQNLYAGTYSPYTLFVFDGHHWDPLEDLALINSPSRLHVIQTANGPELYIKTYGRGIVRYRPKLHLSEHLLPNTSCDVSTSGGMVLIQAAYEENENPQGPRFIVFENGVESAGIPYPEELGYLYGFTTSADGAVLAYGIDAAFERYLWRTGKGQSAWEKVVGPEDGLLLPGGSHSERLFLDGSNLRLLMPDGSTPAVMPRATQLSLVPGYLVAVSKGSFVFSRNDAQFSFDFSSSPGSVTLDRSLPFLDGTIESSADLDTWETLQSVPATSDSGTIEFPVDATPPQSLFLRLRQ